MFPSILPYDFQAKLDAVDIRRCVECRMPGTWYLGFARSRTPAPAAPVEIRGTESCPVFVFFQPEVWIYLVSHDRFQMHARGRGIRATLSSLTTIHDEIVMPSSVDAFTQPVPDLEGMEAIVAALHAKLPPLPPPEAVV